jgi:hypothetical protein
MAGITINIRPFLFVAVYTPFHVVSVNHFHGSISEAGEAMTDGAIHTPLNMNPMGEDDKAWKFVHPLPRNLPASLHIFDDLKSFRSFTDRIACMARLTKFDVWNPCNTIPLYKAVTEGTV